MPVELRSVFPEPSVIDSPLSSVDDEKGLMPLGNKKYFTHSNMQSIENTCN